MAAIRKCFKYTGLGTSDLQDFVVWVELKLLFDKRDDVITCGLVGEIEVARFV